MLSGKRIFITGGAGFIGRHLVNALAAHNDIIVFDNFHRVPAGDTHPAPAHVRVVKGDILDVAAVRDAITGCTHIVHLASIAGVDTVRQIPVTTMRVSLIGTYNVLEAAVAAGGVERFIDFSTSEVFGSYAYKVREGDATSLGAVGEARWTYAVSKLASEHLAHNYHVQYGLPALSIRPFNIYGPGQVGEGAVHRFVVRALRNETIQIHNDGSQIRAWCYVDDIVNAVVLALERPAAVGQALNIGNPRSVCTIYDLARLIIRISGSSSQLEFITWPYPDVELRIPNIDKARRLLEFEPSVELEEGLLRTLEWYRTRPAQVTPAIVAGN